MFVEKWARMWREDASSIFGHPFFFYIFYVLDQYFIFVSKSKEKISQKRNLFFPITFLPSRLSHFHSFSFLPLTIIMLNRRMGIVRKVSSVLGRESNTVSVQKTVGLNICTVSFITAFTDDEINLPQGTDHH